MSDRRRRPLPGIAAELSRLSASVVDGSFVFQRVASSGPGAGKCKKYRHRGMGLGRGVDPQSTNVNKEVDY